MKYFTKSLSINGTAYLFSARYFPLKLYILFTLSSVRDIT